jgi:hypothetical protein
MANLFDKAAASVGADKPKGKKKAKPTIEMADLHTYAALKAAQKTIETVLETLKEDINETALDQFILNRNSSSFDGVDGDTSGSLQLRKRSSRSVLSEQEKLVLDELNIDTDKSADARFYINNKYADDAKLLNKVSKALEGIVPEDFLGATSEKFIVTGDSMNQAFANVKDNDRLRDVLKIVATQAARVTFGGSHEEMLSILDATLKGDDEDLEAQLKASLKK